MSDSSTLGSSKGAVHKSSRRKKISPHDPVKNIRITDIETGVLLFERIYKWHEHANTASLGSLIQSFFQFAREVDDGGSGFFLF